MKGILNTLLFLSPLILSAQSGLDLMTQPYTILSNEATPGQTVDMGNGIVQLTQDIGHNDLNPWQRSAMWGTERIHLDSSFFVELDFYFGCTTDDGGDGILFVLQNDPRGIGALGAGGGFIGYGGNISERITRSIAIEFDTYNGNAWGGTDIDEDHVTVLRNGFVSNNNLEAGPNDKSLWGPAAVNRDLEACVPGGSDFYSARIEWKAPDTLRLFQQGEQLFEIRIDRSLFGSETVYWGFTAGTGSASNEQWVAPRGSNIPWECSMGTCCHDFTITVPGDTLCAGSLTTLQVADDPGYLTYLWSTNDTTPTLTVSQGGVFALTVTQNQSGAYCTSMDSTAVIALPAPAIQTGAPAIICTRESASLSASGGYTYAWSNGETASSFSVSPSVTATYTVTAMDKNGCTGTENVSITVRNCDIEAHNVFTPNGDGTNDYFHITNVEQRAWEVIVYNRWGKKIFETGHYQNNGGPGKCWYGEDASDGVYFYVIRSTESHTAPHSGYVHVVRSAAL